MASYYRQQLEEYLKTLDIKAERVLDVGGSQLSIKDRVKTWDVQEYKVLDLADPHKGEKPNIEWDLNEPIATTDIGKWYQFVGVEEFDVMFCLEVMEYIFNPVVACKNLEFLLKPGGLLYITFPFVYPVHEPREDDVLRYTRRGAIKLLENAGFEIEEIVPRTTKALSLAQFYSAEKMRAAKGYEYHEEVGVIIKARKK